MARELINARIYVSGELGGLVECTADELQIIGNRFRNHYAGEPVVVKTGKNVFQLKATETKPQPVRRAATSTETPAVVAPTRRSHS